MLFSPPSVWRRLLLVLALLPSVPALTLPPQSAFAQPAPQAATGSHEYQIAGGPLGMVLSRFAAASNVVLSFDAALTDGLESAGLQGRYTVDHGFSRLLDGTGLRAVPTVTGYRLARVPARSGGKVSELAPLRVSGTRDARTQAYETPAAVAVVTREEIDRLPPRNTSDLLDAVPGLYTSQSRQNPGVAINLRGLQDFGRVNVMIDGVRQNYQQSGHGVNGQVYVDPELLSGVDVAKGPSSLAGGAAMVAGTVNFRTLAFRDLVEDGEDFGGRVNLTSGSNAYDFSGSAALGWRLGAGEYVLAVSRKKMGEFSPGRRGNVTGDPTMETLLHRPLTFSDQDQKSVLLKGDWHTSGGHSFGLSGSVLDARFTEGAGAGSKNRMRSVIAQGTHAWRGHAGGVSEWSSRLYFSRNRNAVNRPPGQLDTSAYSLRYATSTVGGTTEAVAHLPLGRQEAFLTVGGEFFHDWTSPEAQALTVGADTGIASTYLGSTPEGRRTVASLFAQGELLREDWLEASLGLRYDWYHLKGDGRMRTGAISNPIGVRPSITHVYTRFSVDRNEGAFAPRLAVAVKPIQGVQIFSTVGSSIRPPALTESLLWGLHPGGLFPYYPNPSLKSERARTWDIGVNWTLEQLATDSDRLRMKATWFDSRVKNYITQARVMAPNSTQGLGITGPYAYVNLDGEYRSRGLEIQADYDAGAWFGDISYTRLIATPSEGGYEPFPLGSLVGFPPNRLGEPGTGGILYVMPPRHKLVVGAGVRLFERRLTLGARMRLQSPQSLSTYNQGTTRVYDLWASLAMTERLTLRLAVNNLRDVNYAEPNGASYYVGPGRTVTFSMSATF